MTVCERFFEKKVRGLCIHVFTKYVQFLIQTRFAAACLDIFGTALEKIISQTITVAVRVKIAAFYKMNKIELY